MRKMTRKKCSSSESSEVSPSNCVPHWSERSAGTASIYQSFHRLSSASTVVTASPKKVSKSLGRLGTHLEQGALCCSDSDLLPPRSRYPLKWARNRQPSPPPVALPGPLPSGAPLRRQKLNALLCALRASACCGSRGLRIQTDGKAARAAA